MTTSPPPTDSPEAALARYLATVNARHTHRREVRRQLEDAKLKSSRRGFWWMKD